MEVGQPDGDAGLIPLCAGRPFRRSERGRKNRPAPFGMTVVGMRYREGFLWLYFAFWFSVGVGESVFKHFGDAAVAGFEGAVIEDAEQVATALQGSHGLPA